MKLHWIAWCVALAVVAVPATTTAGAALAAPAPRTSAAGGRPAATGPAQGENVPGGTRLWLARFGHPPNSVGYAQSVMASPDGSQVFIAGSGTGSAAVAYGAATGAQHWASPTGLSNGGFMAVSPDGSRAFVTGTRQNGSGLPRFTT